MRKYSAINLCWTFLLAMLFVVGCGKEAVRVPSVVSTVPTNGATGVAVNSLIQATFNMAMNPASINSSSFTVTAGGHSVPGQVSYSNAMATFTPATALTNGTQYMAAITTGATSAGGTHLLSTYSWSFTTVAPAPTVVSTVPANGATNVAINTGISATFSEAMNPASISGSTFTLSSASGPVSGAVTYSGVMATFTPSTNLASSTMYTATITSGATSTGGISLATSYVWTFTTSSPPPAVVATEPLNSATGVPVDQAVSATFNEAMLCTTLATPATTFSLMGPGTTVVAGTVTCSGSTATFTPSNNLAVNTVYTAMIATSAQSMAGLPLGMAYVWSFRTLPAPTAPTVITTVPVNQATAVPLNQALSATFSVAMNPSSLTSSTFLVTGAGGAAVAGTVTYVAAGSIATFTPTAALDPSTVYTATITTGAENLQATPLAANYTWSFTTAAAVVLAAPTVVSTIPANAATGVPLNQVVSASFNVPMDPTTVNGTNFTLTGPGTQPVAGLVAYAAVGNSLTFTPTANLPASTVFTATIRTGVKDLAGTALASNYVWSFTTGAAVLATAPELTSTSPANAATNVPLNQAVSGTFTEAMNPLTLTTGTFEVTGPGGTSIPGTVSYDPIHFIGTFTPTSLLTASTTYTATITNGATDLANNPLGNSGVSNPWTFTTGAAAVPPPVVLGPTISLFGAFGGSAGITNQGIETVVNGDIGTTAVSTLITGMHDASVVVGGVDECTYTETTLNMGLVTGTINTAPPPPTVGCPNEGTAVTSAFAAQAALEALTAYNTLAGIPNGLDVSVCPGCGGGSAGELGNRTLAPGVYKSAPGSFAISQGDLTLDAKGDPNAYWVFQMATTLTVGTPSTPHSVLLINGAQPQNVFWQVGSAATLEGIVGGGTMEGTIISQTGISISTAGVVAVTTLNGRAIVLTGPVTMVNSVINVP